MSAITLKRGDTFYYTATWEGAELSELRSQIRTTLGKLIDDVVISETNMPHTFALSVTDTSNWPIGILQTDIQRTYSGGVISSETITINVVKDVTQ